MYKTLQNITDHPDIKLSPAEFQRVHANKMAYRNIHVPVTYIDSDGVACERDYNAVNLAKIISRKLAKLVFNEGVMIESIDDEEASDYIRLVLNNNRFEQVFGEELEGGYAISGLAIVPTYDPLDKTIKFTYCSADNFIPLDGNTNIVTEAAILQHYRQVRDDQVVYFTLFAIHKRFEGGYKIKHELYRSIDSDVVGEQVALSTLDDTKDLPNEVHLEGLKKPLFVYIKLAGKNNIDYGSPLGLGVIDNARKQFKNFNDKYDQYMNEIDTATRQLVASSQFFDFKYDSNGVPRRVFNPGTQVWQKLNSEDPIIQDFSPAIRATEYIESLNFILRIIEQSVGFSAGTISFDGKSVKTATEVISENTDTYQTRADNVLILEQALKDLIMNVFYLSSYYGIYKGNITDLDVSVDFDDGVFTSKADRQNYAATGKSLGLLSARTAMKRAYGWTEDEANEEYAKILQEQRDSNPESYQAYAEQEIFGVNEFDLAVEQEEDEDLVPLDE